MNLFQVMNLGLKQEPYVDIMHTLILLIKLNTPKAQTELIVGSMYGSMLTAIREKEILTSFPTSYKHEHSIVK
jgi:hypothetical protein